MKKKLGIFIVISAIAMVFNSIFPLLNISNNDKAIAADSIASNLKILEIKPDYRDSYELNYLKGKKIDNRDIELIQMTLNQFNSMRNDVNGEIDIIYFSKGSYGLVYGDRDPNPPKYGDRIDPYGSEGNYAPRRYNDITNLRASKIIEMIESGQLVYINREAFLDGKSNIYENLSIYRNNWSCPNFKEISTLPSENKIKNDYMNSYKRPNISLFGSPSGEYKSGQFANIAFRLMSSNNGYSKYKVNFYIDENRDGLFKEDEIKKSIDNCNYDDQIHNIEYEIPLMYTGPVYWKFEIIEKVSNVKNIRTGSFMYKGKSIEPKVLQISPGKGNNLDLSRVLKNKNLIKGDGYNINVEYTTTEKFEDTFYKNTGKFNNLGENYDMVIFGFGDMYEYGDIRNKNAMDEIWKFYNTGQGLMLTHDTIWYVENVENNFPWNLSRYFVQAAGQTHTGENLYRELISPIVNWKWQWRGYAPVYGNKDIDKYSSPPPEVNANNQYMQYTYFRPRNYPNGTGEYKIGQTYSSKIKKVNNGVVTDYPYTFNKEVLDVAETHDMYYTLNLEDEDVVPWYNLYIDDKNKDSTNTRYYYYTYSTKNLTFSGTGHAPSEIEKRDDELKLFVNTIVKGYLAANHKPEITIIKPEINQEISTQDNSIYISFTPFDYDIADADKLNVKVYIEDEKGDYILSKEYKDCKSGNTISDAIDNPYSGTSLKDRDFNLKFVITDTRQASVLQYVNLKLVNNNILPKPELKHSIFQNTNNPIILGKVGKKNNDEYLVKIWILDSKGQSIYSTIINTDADGNFMVNPLNIPDIKDFSKPYIVNAQSIPKPNIGSKESPIAEGELYIDTKPPAIENESIDDKQFSNNIVINNLQPILKSTVNDIDPKVRTLLTLERYEGDGYITIVTSNIESTDKFTNISWKPSDYVETQGTVGILENGRYRYTIKCVDRCNNTSVKKYEFTISNNFLEMNFAGARGNNIVATDGSLVSIRLSINPGFPIERGKLEIPIEFKSGIYSSFNNSNGYIITNDNRLILNENKGSSGVVKVIIDEPIKATDVRNYNFYVKCNTVSKNNIDNLHISINPDNIKYNGEKKKLLDNEVKVKIPVMKLYIR